MFPPHQPVALRHDTAQMAGVCRRLHGAAFLCSRLSSSARRSKSAAMAANKRAKNALSAAAAFSFEVFMRRSLFFFTREAYPKASEILGGLSRAV